MQANQIESLTANFEACSQLTESNIEFWLARDLQHLLGYTEWRNFTTTAISKAKTACELSGHANWTILLTSTKWSSWDQAVSAKSTT